VFIPCLENLYTWPDVLEDLPTCLLTMYETHIDFNLHCGELTEIYEQSNSATSMDFRDYEKVFDKLIRNIQWQLQANFSHDTQ